MSRSSWALLCLSCFLPCAQGEGALPAPAQNAAATSSPGPTPQIFAPGVISGPGNDGSPTFSPDGNTLFFTRSTSHWTIILESHQVQGKWSTPIVAPFSGEWPGILSRDVPGWHLYRLPDASPCSGRRSIRTLACGQNANRMANARTAAGHGQHQQLRVEAEYRCGRNALFHEHRQGRQQTSFLLQI
jgi:hypothetical protein